MGPDPATAANLSSYSSFTAASAGCPPAQSPLINSLSNEDQERMSILNHLTDQILNIRLPKQPAETILKYVLFVKDRCSIIHQSEYEKTPTILADPKVSPLEEIMARSRVIDHVKQLVDYLTQDTRRAGTSTAFGCGGVGGNTMVTATHALYDEMAIKSELIYNCCNYVNAYFNMNTISSVDSLDLAIAAVWLSSKSSSNFKRLEKIVLSARHLYSREKKCDKNHYSCIEMDILQALGFQVDLADDYPQKYITSFMTRMTEKCDAFRANSKKSKTLCDVALQFANVISNLTPLMINREACVLAASCLYISNSFKPILNIKDWWKVIEGCEDVKESKITSTADLIYDVVRYSQNNWQLVQILHVQNQMQQGYNIKEQAGLVGSCGKLKTINSPYSNYSSASNQTSGFISNGSSPHSRTGSLVGLPSMLSPASSTLSQPINKMKTDSQKTPGDDNWDKTSHKSEGAVSACSSISKNSASESQSDTASLANSSQARQKKRDDQHKMSPLVTENYIFKDSNEVRSQDPRRRPENSKNYKNDCRNKSDPSKKVQASSSKITGTLCKTPTSVATSATFMKERLQDESATGARVFVGGTEDQKKLQKAAELTTFEGQKPGLGSFSKPSKIPNSKLGSGKLVSHQPSDDYYSRKKNFSGNAPSSKQLLLNYNKKRKFSELQNAPTDTSVPPPPPPERADRRRDSLSPNHKIQRLTIHSSRANVASSSYTGAPRGGSPRPQNYIINNTIPSRSNTILTKASGLTSAIDYELRANEIIRTKNASGNGTSNGSGSKGGATDDDHKVGKVAPQLEVKETFTHTSGETSTPKTKNTSGDSINTETEKEAIKRGHQSTPIKSKYHKLPQDQASSGYYSAKSYSPSNKLYDPLKVFASELSTPKRGGERSDRSERVERGERVDRSERTPVRRREYSSHSSASSMSSLNSSVNSGVDLDQTLQNLYDSPSHPFEAKYQSRLQAIKSDSSVLRFYASSKSRYRTLPRKEKDLVKRLANQIKHKKMSRSMMEE